MSYVDSIVEKDIVKVVERAPDGTRKFVDYPAEYTFYVNDDNGKHTSMFGERVRKISTKTNKEFQKEKRIHSHLKTHEIDFLPLGRCLERNYLNKPAPKLHTCYFDIEADFEAFKYPEDKMVKIRSIKEMINYEEEQEVVVRELHNYTTGYEVWDESEKQWVDVEGCQYLESGRGFAPVDDPFNAITAITVYLDWMNELITLVMPPNTITEEEGQQIVDTFPNTVMYMDEAEMLKDFLDLVKDADIISGWNSESYDVPYTVNRITKVLSKDYTRKLCLWGKFPKKRTFEKFGVETYTYDLIGRVHLDYMLLYQKYTYQEMHSYSLDAISEHELGDKKVPYSGTLDDLYKKDFKLFVEYSRQDVHLLYKMNVKLKFIELANEIAHANTVLIPKTMGAVAVTEQAIVNEIHSKGLVVLNKVHHSEDENTSAAGAYVAYPKVGLHKYIGSLDINSLYPSVIRALNMSNETIIGQLRSTMTDAYIQDKMSETETKGKVHKGESFAAAWEGIFGSLEYTEVMNKSDEMITIDFEDGSVQELPAKDVYEYIFNNSNWTLSANGTIFTLAKEGIIPGLLDTWYNDRKVMQKTKKNYLRLEAGISIPDRLLC